jgi:hypothetical protein
MRKVGVKQFEIYHANYHWKTRDYPGFFLVIRQEGPHWLCLAISSTDPNDEAIELNESDPDFAATGLDHTSYVYDGAQYCKIAPEDFGNRKGELQGQLLSKFRKESGF